MELQLSQLPGAPDRLDYLFGLLELARIEQESRRRRFAGPFTPYLALLQAIEERDQLERSA